MRDADLSVPEQARRWHEEGRAAAGTGDPARALELFAKAHERAPAWPYPPYDIAFTYLLADELGLAEQWYAEVDRLAPRGFFTAKTSLHTIRRERSGTMPPGFSKAFTMLEWMPEDARRRAVQQITTDFPDFGPAWKVLATLLDDDDERWVAIERGLAVESDDETHGLLVLNKALLLERRGEGQRAVGLVQALLESARCTAAVQTMGTITLRQLEQRP